MALKGEVFGLQQCDGARGEGDDQLQREGGVHTQEGGGQQGGQQYQYPRDQGQGSHEHSVGSSSGDGMS